MSDLDYVFNLINPWLDKYIACGVESLVPEEIIGVGISTPEAEVNNGGFDQYYFNSDGELAVPTVNALKRIGAHRTAATLAAANAEFPDALPPADRSLRQQQLERSAPLPGSRCWTKSSTKDTKIWSLSSRCISEVRCQRQGHSNECPASSVMLIGKAPPAYRVPSAVRECNDPDDNVPAPSVSR